MAMRIELGDITVDVVKKDIKNVHLSVYPPAGRVRISAPSRMSLDTIRVFAISKLDWIRRQQKKLREQERETRREYLDRESHYVWGKRYLLSIIECEQAPAVALKHNRMILTVRPGTDQAAKEAVIAQWCRNQIKMAAPELIARWSPIIGVKVNQVFVQKMKTKWGGCNPVRRSIRLNTDLSKKPPQCLEYIVVHELVHLRERNHGDRFMALMDAYLPQWRQFRKLLNGAPLGHEDWSY